MSSLQQSARLIATLLMLASINIARSSEIASPAPTITQAMAEGKNFSFYIKNPDDILAAIHGGHLALPLMPAGMEALSEPNLGSALILSVKVRDVSGTIIGTATQMEYFDAIKQKNRSLTHTTWTVQIPDQGTLFLYTNEYISPEFKKILKDVTGKGTPWEGNINVQTSAGPLPNGHGIIAGGTGFFTGASGEFIERNIFRKYTVDRELHGEMELRLIFNAEMNSAGQ